MKDNRKGFTLVELLGIIVVLGIVVSIGIYAVTTSIRKAKEKTYQVTLNTIKDEADKYLIENKEKLFFVSLDNGYEYQCVTVQNLIDSGYLKDNVTESFVADNVNVSKNDFVYLKRNVSSKSIVEIRYVNNDSQEAQCQSARDAISDIAILVSPSDEWAKEREVTIIYNLKNINNYDELDNYLYGYTFGEDANEDKVTRKEFTVTSNGQVVANIKYNNEIINSKEKDITGIDTVGPVVSLGTYTNGDVNKSATVPLVVTDQGSGVNYPSFTKDDLIVKIGDNTISADKYDLSYKSGNNYELKINDVSETGKLVITINHDNIFDNLNNGNADTVLEPDITFKASSQGGNSGSGGNISGKCEFTTTIEGMSARCYGTYVCYGDNLYCTDATCVYTIDGKERYKSGQSAYYGKSDSCQP